MVQRRKHLVDPISPRPPHIEFVDTTGRPIEGMQYNLKVSGNTSDGTTPSDGAVTIDPSAGGDVEIKISPTQAGEEE